ncbi:MAG TPA: tRNA 2-thiouridine(34) synthase MnmA [Ruminococcus sp.]|nr:tRNA 2-thiouridine(34) synthase MnmA [Ruminococcus sp.]
MKKALIAMSGGVDSSVAAYLMTQAGYECTGCTMKLYDNETACAAKEKTCCSLDDIEDARAIAYRLGMPYYVFNFKAEFEQQVIGKFVDCYRCGRTPNPCIDCNRYMKFERLLERAAILGCEKVVTGHYAQIAESAHGLMLKRSADPSKDQTYVLYMLTQEQLAHIAFPLGGLTKQQVRQIAEEQGFVNAHKRDSQDICFVPDGDYARVIEHYTGERSEPGEFVDTAGNVIGTHSGLIHYTIGQRRGLGIAIGKPAYVCGLDPAHNRVIIGTNEDLFTDTCTVSGINWNAGAIPQEPVRCEAKIRYRHPAQPASVTFQDAHTAVLKFDTPQRAITAGQSAVFYDGDWVLGGGEIVNSSG